MVICVICVVLFVVAYFSYIEHKYSDGSNITKFLVGSSGSVLEKTQKLKYMVNKLDKKPSIWQGKNGFWYVYVPDATKKRKMRLVKRKSKESLEKYIRDFYNEFKE